MHIQSQPFYKEIFEKNKALFDPKSPIEQSLEVPWRKENVLGEYF
jgi:hypothetical protein